MIDRIRRFVGSSLMLAGTFFAGLGLKVYPTDMEELAQMSEEELQKQFENESS